MANHDLLFSSVVMWLKMAQVLMLSFHFGSMSGLMHIFIFNCYLFEIFRKTYLFILLNFVQKNNHMSKN